MNGEAKDFNEARRNILPSHIITKFYILHFDEIKEKESENIFKQQLEKCQNYKATQQAFINLHKKMSKEKQIITDPVVALRNLKNYIYFDKSKVAPRIAAEILYVGRFPKEERNKYKDIINQFGDLILDENKLGKITEKFKEENIIYDEDNDFEKNSYVKAVYLGLTACESGFHPLLVGKNGSGLTTLSK